MALHGHTHSVAVHPPRKAGDHSYPLIIGGGPRMENGTVTVLSADRTGLEASIINTKGETLGSYRV